MIPIREKARIQIEITNACTNQCVNCSRFVGHHRKPYFMELAQIEAALDTVSSFPRSVGIMGGEPTLHPQFEEICELVRKKIPPDKRYLMTAGYKWDQYKGIIKKTFGENLSYNDHNDVTQKHHPLLLSISDMFDDPELIQRSIDDCWVDKRWSASINHKGAFFCEVAAAMDVLFGGPGGHPVERHWWEKEPAHFLDQQQRYCYHCGACVPFRPVTLEDNMDVVSQSNYRRLSEVGSPRLQAGRVKVITEKMSEAELAAMAENWTPWDHHGEIEKVAKTSPADRYGGFFSWRVRLKMRIRQRFWTFRRAEVKASRLLWKLRNR